LTISLDSYLARQNAPDDTLDHFYANETANLDGVMQIISSFAAQILDLDIHLHSRLYEGSRIFASFQQTMPMLHSIYLGTVGVCDSQFEFLGLAPQLHKLSVNGVFIPQLKQHVSWNQLTQLHITEYIDRDEFVQTIENCVAVEELEIELLYYPELWCEYANTPTITTPINRLQCLEIFRLSVPPLDDDPDTSVPGIVVRDVLRGIDAPSLQTLSISCEDPLPHGLFNTFVQAGRTSITELELEWARVMSKPATTILSHGPNVTSLQIGCHVVDDEVLESLRGDSDPLLMPSLRKLRIGDWKVKCDMQRHFTDDALLQMVSSRVPREELSELNTQVQVSTPVSLELLDVCVNRPLEDTTIDILYNLKSFGMTFIYEVRISFLHIL
jgi:hypothetical protein